MSNVIPILSSSPPPIDDSPSFDDNWDNNSDFGGFQDAGATESVTFSAKPPFPAKNELQLKDANQNNGLANDSLDDDWADFSGAVLPPPVVDGEFVAFSTDDSKTGSSASVSVKDNTIDETLQQADIPSHIGLQLRSAIDRTVAHGDGQKSPRSSSSSTGSHEDRQNSCTEEYKEYNARPHEPKSSKTDAQDNTSQDSVTDSGLCSDISPVPKFEEYPDFGDNKSSEVEFSDEGPSKLGTTIELDEGFANFSTRDSCGTGSDSQSPDRDSADHKFALNFKQHNCTDSLDFRPATFDEESQSEEVGFRKFDYDNGKASCISSEYDPEAITPTQSQYDTDNVRSSNSSSPSPKISPDQENSDQTGSDLFSRGTPQSRHEETPTDNSESCDTLEGCRAKSAEPESANDISDFQSTGSVINFTAFQGGDVEVSTVTSSCDSSGTQQIASTAQTEDTLATPSVATHSSHSVTSDKAGASGDENFESEDEWDFKEAGATPESVENISTQKLPCDSTPEHTDNKDNVDDEFGDLAFRPAQTADNDAAEDEEDDWAFQGSGVQAAQVDEDDDFGDFSSTANETGFADFGSSKPNDDGNNNWASFAEHTLPSPEDDNQVDDDGEFGDFGEAVVTSKGTADNTDPQSLPSANSSTQLTSKVQILKKESLKEAVSHSFSPPPMPHDIPDVDLLYIHMTRQNLRQEPPPVKQPGRHTNVKSTTTDMNVWNNLRDLDKTAALRYTWDKSTNSRCLLSALTIDTRNILIGHKKPSVPIFAANLGCGMLEPSRGVPEAGREGRVSHVNTTSVNSNNNKLTAGTPQDIPPAEFDWSSAGLTNPLDSSNIQLDLDFFIKKTAWSGYSAYTATSPTAALENELLKSIEPLESKQPKTLEPLANYLANLKVASTAPPSMSQENDTDSMTEAAYEIVSHFPETSFMHAKMLMFPVKESSSD